MGISLALFTVLTLTSPALSQGLLVPLTDARSVSAFSGSFNTAQGAIQSGETWRFQWIFRDAGGAGLNLSDVSWVTFAP